MSDTGFERFVLSSAVRLVWPSVVTPKAAHTHNGISYKSQYEGRFLFRPDHPDLPEVRRIIGALTVATFGAIKPGLKFPIEAGDPLADAGKAKTPPVDREFFRGMGVLTAHSVVTKQNGDKARPPTLVLFRGGEDYRVFGEDERNAAAPFFYPGVEVLGEFSFSAFTGMGGGVTCYLNELVSLNTGERMAGAYDPATKYGAAASRHVGTVSSVDPTVAAAGVGSAQTGAQLPF